MFLCHKTSGRELVKRLFSVVVCLLRFQPCHKFSDSLAERYLGRVSKGIRAISLPTWAMFTG